MIVALPSGGLCQPRIMSATPGQQFKGLCSEPDVVFCTPSAARAEKVRVADTARLLLGPLLTAAASLEFGSWKNGISDGVRVEVWG